MRRPRTRLAGPVLGTDRPLPLAEFYSRLLGWPIGAHERSWVAGVAHDWVIIRSPSGDQKLEFQYEPGFRPPVWPAIEGAPQLQMHLDIGVEDLEAGVAWARECGATVAGYQPQPQVRVMRDPSGHLFCLFPDPA